MPSPDVTAALAKTPWINSYTSFSTYTVTSGNIGDNNYLTFLEGGILFPAVVAIFAIGWFVGVAITICAARHRCGLKCCWPKRVRYPEYAQKARCSAYLTGLGITIFLALAAAAIAFYGGFLLYNNINTAQTVVNETSDFQGDIQHTVGKVQADVNHDLAALTLLSAAINASAHGTPSQQASVQDAIAHVNSVDGDITNANNLANTNLYLSNANTYLNNTPTYTLWADVGLLVFLLALCVPLYGLLTAESAEWDNRKTKNCRCILRATKLSRDARGCATATYVLGLLLLVVLALLGAVFLGVSMDASIVCNIGLSNFLYSKFNSSDLHYYVDCPDPEAPSPFDGDMISLQQSINVSIADVVAIQNDPNAQMDPNIIAAANSSLANLTATNAAANDLRTMFKCGRFHHIWLDASGLACPDLPYTFLILFVGFVSPLLLFGMFYCLSVYRPYYSPKHNETARKDERAEASGGTSTEAARLNPVPVAEVPPVALPAAAAAPAAAEAESEGEESA